MAEITSQRKEYLKIYQRNWMRNRRRQYFKDKQCCKCGSRDHMELDHIDPALKVEHKIWSWSKRRRDEELLKCQILCRACHKRKSALERGFFSPEDHGRSMSYKKGCRCVYCKKWRNLHHLRRTGRLTLENYLLAIKENVEEARRNKCSQVAD